MLDYCHLVEIDEDRRQLAVYRMYSDGKKELFTMVDLPSTAFKGNNEDAFGEFARLLGENLLLDSPIARRLLGL
jgi:hypothetical protein